jgi:Fe-S cluster biosynthesis and repair protein YggX
MKATPFSPICSSIALAHQTMLINENRLSPINPGDRKFLEGEMEKFLFGEGSAAPQGYVPPA